MGWIRRLRERRAADRAFVRELRRLHDEMPPADFLPDVEAEADELLALGPLTLDVCATCHKPLHLNERVEVLVGDITYEGEYGGSTATLATYCKEHAP